MKKLLGALAGLFLLSALAYAQHGKNMPEGGVAAQRCRWRCGNAALIFETESNASSRNVTLIRSGRLAYRSGWLGPTPTTERHQ